MSRSHQVRRTAMFIRAFLRACLSFPLRLAHRLFHNILQLYSRVTSTRLKRNHANPLSAQVAGSSLPILPQHNQPQSHCYPPSAPSSNTPFPIFPVPTAPQEPGPCVLRLASNPASFKPFTPSEVKRYDKHPTINPDNELRVIHAATRCYMDIQGGENWNACVHPEGALYFHDTARGIYTDSDLQTQECRDEMNTWVDGLLTLAATHGLNPTGGVQIELVVQLIENESGDLICNYYFVDHPKSLLFWLHEQDTDMLVAGLRGVEKLSHIKYAVESEYWQVCH